MNNDVERQRELLWRLERTLTVLVGHDTAEKVRIPGHGDGDSDIIVMAIPG